MSLPASEVEINCTHCQTPNPITARYCGHCAERLPLPVGEFFAGRYTVRAYQGVAGITRRYRVESQDSEAPLTLVELRQNRGWTPEAQSYYRAQFEREAALFAELQALPAVPALYQAVAERGGHVFFVLGEMPETTLQEALAQRQRPYPPDVVIDWGIRLGEVLVQMHAQGLLHADLQPRRVGVAGPTVRLFDFNLTRAIRADGLPTAPEDNGFTAPEQLAGSPEPRSELYNLAAIMAVLLTNRPPPAPSPDDDVLARQNPRVPAWLSQLIAINLNIEPYDRYARAGDMVGDLRHQQVTDTLICRACGAANRRSEIYCQECARALLQSVRVCEICEREMPANARFCPTCGVRAQGL